MGLRIVPWGRGRNRVGRYTLRSGMPGGGHVYCASNCICTGMRPSRGESLSCYGSTFTAHRKLTCYHGHEFGELVNRWSDPSYREDRLRLLARIIDHAERLERRVERMCYA